MTKKLTKKQREITLENESVISEFIKEVEGKARTRKIAFSEIYNVCKNFDEIYDLKKKNVNGTKIRLIPYSTSFPRVYKYSPSGSIAYLENKAGKWYLKDFTRYYNVDKKESYIIFSEAAEEELLQKLSLFKFCSNKNFYKKQKEEKECIEFWKNKFYRTSLKLEKDENRNSVLRVNQDGEIKEFRIPYFDRMYNFVGANFVSDKFKKYLETDFCSDFLGTITISKNNHVRKFDNQEFDFPPQTYGTYDIYYCSTYTPFEIKDELFFVKKDSIQL